jgi:predicted amidophosphoribosyltransferase
MTESSEYWEGYRACYMNAQAECPYDVGTDEWKDWNRGFDQAEKELSKKNREELE